MQTTKAPKLKTKRSKISYAKWCYVFIAPFFLAYALFHFAPQLLTIYNSFFENYREGLTQVGPNFVVCIRTPPLILRRSSQRAGAAGSEARPKSAPGQGVCPAPGSRRIYGVTMVGYFSLMYL